MSTAAVETDEKPPEPQVEEGGGVVEIPPDPPKPEPAEPKPSRADRRTERAQAYGEDARQARDEARQAREAQQRMAVELAELKGRVSATPAGPDPNQKALDDIATKMENVVQRMGQGDASAVKEWHELRREENRVIAKMEAANEGKAVEERVTKAMPQQMDPRQAALMAEFPSLQDDETFRAVANGKVATLIATQKRDMSNPTVRFATLREGAALAARELGIGGKETREPTQRDRDRVSGTGSGDSGAGGSTRVQLTRDQMKMAEQLFRNLPAEEAHVKWWKDVGSKIANK